MFYSARCSLHVLTRPLADVSAPKHTAVSPHHSVIAGFFISPVDIFLYNKIAQFLKVIS
jgi:hypothetical protein